MHNRDFSRSQSIIVLLTAVLLASVAFAGDKALTFTDLMKFHEIHDASISEEGQWIAYALIPDRGDGEVVIRSTEDDREFRIELGTKPLIASGGAWVVAAIEPTLEEKEKAAEKSKGKSKDNGPQKGLALVDLGNGKEIRIEKVESFALSEDGEWLAYKHYREDKNAEDIDTEETEKPPQEEEANDEKKAKKEDKNLGTTLKLRNLANGEEKPVPWVTTFSFDDSATVLAYVISAPDGESNGLYLQNLSDTASDVVSAHQQTNGHYTELAWAHEQPQLAFVASVRDEDGEPTGAEVWTWRSGAESTLLAGSDDAPEGFKLPVKNELEWSRDGNRLFLGFAVADPADEETDPVDSDEEPEEEKPFDPYDIDALVAKRGLDVWHWNDPLIIPHQKKRWDREEKDRTYLAVAHLDSGRIVPLAKLDIPKVQTADNGNVTLAGSPLPYLKEVTWDGGYGDVYVVDLTTGNEQIVVKRIATGRRPPVSLSPGGRFVLYYDAGDWHLYTVADASTTNLTESMHVPFANEDHDYPSDPPGYGHSEWFSDDSGVLIYDKYDIWQVSTQTGEMTNLTKGEGRKNETEFRVIDTNDEIDWIDASDELLLSAYHDKEKHFAFYSSHPSGGGVKSLYETRNHRVDFVARAEDTGQILFTRQRYDEFPNLWITDSKFKHSMRLSDVNPQIADYAWGKAELIEWSSADGIPLQGILIKPGNYEPGKRYPVLVYYYRFFTQRLHSFNQPVVNHRPSYPIYASNDYAVFLPDIRFQVGQPGFSATKCLVPGVQKLVDMGIADPDAIGLHGHSWSGYQTAFVITQTDLFAAAVAGAPVSNMTSAYSGIRLQTGLARQFQYEKSQSRIGGSLWEYPERYIENSPVFFADRINTPLLIQFGDDDGAVPWEQGIELYLACRRLGKDCIFLQYRGEPHHLKKYPNKVDYSIKMKQFFDHHLKGEPAPEWMTEGVPYQGK
ncbi:MAG: S9 family peptidase [bacterium]|nr:S9 family peptidase [bacterium]